MTYDVVMRQKTVVVIFSVAADTQVEAEQIVEDRLNSVRLLQQNDSTDIQRGTLDPITTLGVVPASKLFEEWI